MDTIANMLTTIVNAQSIGKERVAVPHSSFKEQLARLMQEKGFLAKIRIQEGTKAKIVLTLAYDGNQPLISSAKRISSPGNKIYLKKNHIPFSGNKPGIYVISTSKGLMDHNQARRENLGGEIICAIWK